MRTADLSPTSTYDGCSPHCRHRRSPPCCRNRRLCRQRHRHRAAAISNCFANFRRTFRRNMTASSDRSSIQQQQQQQLEHYGQPDCRHTSNAMYYRHLAAYSGCSRLPYNDRPISNGAVAVHYIAAVPLNGTAADHRSSFCRSCSWCPSRTWRPRTNVVPLKKHERK